MSQERKESCISSNIDLILCSRPPFCCYAREQGMLVGARSDHSQQLSCCKPEFLDYNFHKPNYERHLAIVKKFRPKYAVVPDLFNPEQLPEVIKQADQIAEYVENIIIVPKYSGAIESIPENYIIGLSVPTKYGDCGNILPLELYGRRVHLLGGSPHMQYKIWSQFAGLNVVSIDGNAYMLYATYGDFWDAKKCGRNSQYRGKGLDRGDLIKMSIDNVVSFWRDYCTK